MIDSPWRLEEFLLPPGLRIFATILLVAGFVDLGERLARFLVGSDADPDDRAAGFILAVAGVGAAGHALALGQRADLTLLRLFASAIAIAGAFQLHHASRAAARFFSGAADAFRLLPPLHRNALILCGVLLGAFAAAALGPPTDADSLDVHVGVPLDWLRHHGAYPRPDWHHARLAGLGEAIVMIGLAAGTDALGACLQVAGLVVAARAVSRWASSASDQVTAWLLVFGCPAMLFLVLTQKFELLPAAATTLALTIVIRHQDHLDASRLTLAFGAAAFAVGCKYPFMLSAAVVIALGLLAAYRSRQLGTALAIAGAALAMLAAPVYVRNGMFHGDPVSPFLERFRSHPDPALVAFADSLRQPDGSSVTWAAMLRFPLALVVPLSAAGISQTLGLGVLCVFAVRLENRIARRWLTAAAVVSGLLLVFGQLSPRFFLEPYLWCAAAATSASAVRLKQLIAPLLVLQSGAVAVAALVMAATLAPAAFSDTVRDRMMTRMAVGYAETKWMDAVLPANAIVLASTRSHALVPRRFVVPDALQRGALERGDDLHHFLSASRVSAIAYELSGSAPLRDFVRKCGSPLAEGVFTRAARNPWTARSESTLTAAVIDWTRGGCR